MKFFFYVTANLLCTFDIFDLFGLLILLISAFGIFRLGVPRNHKGILDYPRNIVTITIKTSSITNMLLLIKHLINLLPLKEASHFSSVYDV